MSAFHHAVVLTIVPVERVPRKLTSALCADEMSPELSAEPISESKEVNEELLELLEEESVELLVVVLLVLPVDEDSWDEIRLVSEL